MDKETLTDLISAYALGILPESDRAEVEALCAQDEQARALLEDYLAMSAVFALSAPARPAPTHLQSDLQRRLQAEKAPATPPVVLPRPQTARRPLPLILGSVAAMLILLVGLVVAFGQVRPATAENTYRALVAERDSARVMVQSEGSIVGELVVSSDRMQAVIYVTQLPPLNTEQTFQLWLVDENGAQSAGLFQAPNPAEQYVLLPLERPLSTYSRVGVSVEPQGGSPLGNRPSSAPIFFIDVSEL